MNENLPYEDELLKRLDDLPLPNEDIAWEDMKRRLEKNDDDTPIIPPLLKGCGGYALLLTILVIAGLLILDPGKWFDGKIKKEPVKNTITESKSEENTTKESSNEKQSANNTNNKVGVNNDTVLIKKKASDSIQVNDSFLELKDSLKSRLSNGSKNNKDVPYTAINKQNIKINNSLKRQNNNNHTKKYQPKPVTKKTGGKLNIQVSGSESDTTGDPLNINEVGAQTPTKGNDSNVTTITKATPTLDPAKKKTDTTISNNTKVKPDSAEKKRIYFSAGLALHQLLPVAGQKTNPYNSLGRKSSFGDYIPSVYLRMYKEGKWFIQSEFRYGAPQYTKEIIFNQKKIIDTGSTGPNATITTNSSIKKTFYHQLPISFNYFVLPGLSIGAGITFNKFQSALVQQDVRISSTQFPVDSLLSTGLVSQKKADSNFVTTYIQGLIEIQYRWRRLSAGARYSFGLQPYLKFSLPGGEERRERNSALQLFIRYEIWRSAKK